MLVAKLVHDSQETLMPPVDNEVINISNFNRDISNLNRDISNSNRDISNFNRDISILIEISLFK